MVNDLIEKTKTHFIKTFERANPHILLYAYLPKHVLECEKWAKKILKDHPEANKEIVLLSVWLHDIGQAFKPKEEDHAVKSERETRRFLSETGLAPEIIEKITHCVRAHRNKDIIPETLEAKILAAADSASHMTDICYIDMVQNVDKATVLAKIERDYRDVNFFPELKKEITPLYQAWKELVRLFPG